MSEQEIELSSIGFSDSSDLEEEAVSMDPEENAKHKATELAKKKALEEQQRKQKQLEQQKKAAAEKERLEKMSEAEK